MLIKKIQSMGNSQQQNVKHYINKFSSAQCLQEIASYPASPQIISQCTTESSNS